MWVRTGGDVSLYTTYILGEGAIGFEPVGAKSALRNGS